MATPATDIDICNLALDRVGQKSIAAAADLDVPTTLSEEICGRHYDTTRRELLRRFIFNFAKVYVVLSKNAEPAPAFGFSTRYTLPADFVRLMALGDITINFDTPKDLYDIVGTEIFTSHQDAEDQINLHYLKNATDVTKFDALFVQLFKLTLASNMAYKFTLKPSLIRGLQVELTKIEVAAAAVAGQEKPPRRIERSRIRAVRRNGSRRDTTRIF